MFLKLFLAFALIPIAEIYVLIELGGRIGSLTTVGVVIITALLGAALARMQGAHTMRQVKSKLNQGIMPAEDMLDALLIFIAGIVLLTPGFITDIAGLLILFPLTRYWFKRYLRYKFDQWMKTKTVRIHIKPPEDRII